MGASTAVTASGSRAATGTAAPPCAMCLLDSSASGALSMTMSSGGISVTGGKLVVDSTSATAASIVGSGTVTTSGSNLVAGGYQVVDAGGFTPTPITGSVALSDPLSTLPAPSVSGTASSVNLVVTSGTINPGIYSSISATGAGITLTMNPGIDVITGSFSVTGGVSVTGNGVLLCFGCSSYPTACTPGQSGGSLSLTGTGTFSLTAPTASTCSSIPATCASKGMLVYYDRNDAATMSITGTGTGPGGTIYGRSAWLTLTTSGGGTVSSSIIVDKVTFTGSGTLTVSYQSSQNYNVASGGNPVR